MFRPPLRGFLMDGDFYVAASLATTLTKLALRYVDIVQDKKKQNVSLFYYRFFKLSKLSFF